MNEKDYDYDKGVAEVKAYYDLHKIKGDMELTAKTQSQLIKQLFWQSLAIGFVIGVILEIIIK